MSELKMRLVRSTNSEQNIGKKVKIGCSQLLTANKKKQYHTVRRDKKMEIMFCSRIIIANKHVFSFFISSNVMTLSPFYLQLLTANK